MDNASRLELLQKTYDRLFTSGITLSKLRDAAIAERLFSVSSDSITVAGRSLAWKLFLAKEEPLHAALPPRSSSLLKVIRESRTAYATLLAEKTLPPDAKHGKGDSSHVGSQSLDDGMEGLDLNNPLSLHDENPWNEWFSGLELRKVISQDVERTFPDIAFFRESDVQDQLTNILFLHSVMHPSIGYRQGMHELLAPLYFAVAFDTVTAEELPDTRYRDLIDLSSPEFIAADAWALFDIVMSGVSRWYEWREPLYGRAADTRILSPFPNHTQIPNGQNGVQPYIAPIVQVCNHIQNNLLQVCDPLLWQHIQKAGIEPQIYGIRWLRLLFTREFSMSDALKLWDGLFACDSTLDLAQWICVAMLIRIRNELIPADYSGQLTTLLRYPSPDPSYRTEGVPHHTTLLLRQALALQMAPNPSTGATIVMENRTLLKIPIEMPTGTSSQQKKVHSGRPPASLSGSTSIRGHSRYPSSPASNLSELFTRGIVERGESLGINKTLMNAVTEIKRNIPELAASLGVRAPERQPSSFPLMDERPVEERPPWEPRTRFEVENEISRVHARDKVLGESLAWIVDALLQDESETKDASLIKLQKREALESLSYVRDVLMMNTLDLDNDRLLGAEEKTRRKFKAEKESERLRAASKLAVVPPPTPLPVVDSHSRVAAKLRYPQAAPFAHTRFSRSAATDPPQRVTRNYNHSSFSTPTSATLAGVMPRLPPPTSTGSRREVQNLKSRGQTPPPHDEYQDPLGALRSV